ncbi:cupin domain-containing protein [Paraburkholderia sp. Tr-20389]|uniref:cupin domain-containing protein n=1 Tax=Paraburkholderia sp. Tr-20389 TaxID=2703903 RepID=UPI00197D29B1|nr:cupin domain-containing protein [Paraburkholderia sp. Tr-20389]MBN3754427.1 cupin domain-containing protein [Paraburkholderia sp. Tr-20389]
MNKALFASMVLMGAIASTASHAETIKPVRVSQADLAGSIFNRKDTVTKNENGNRSSDAVTYTSPDNAYQTGVYKSGPLHEEIKGPEGLPYNEFLYFLSGSVKLTSSDGSVMVVKTGEGVTLPKGWTGQFDTKGYTKLYVTYDPAEANKAKQ